MGKRRSARFDTAPPPAKHIISTDGSDEDCSSSESVTSGSDSEGASLSPSISPLVNTVCGLPSPATLQRAAPPADNRPKIVGASAKKITIHDSQVPAEFAMKYVKETLPVSAAASTRPEASASSAEKTNNSAENASHLNHYADQVFEGAEKQ